MSAKIVLLIAALYVATTTALPTCVCTRNLVPVCGSDGKTYSNKCVLECESSKGKADLTLVKDGPCDAAAEAICICTFEYMPVCGTDGKTYPNQCSFDCEKAKNAVLDIASRGQCLEGEVKVVDNNEKPKDEVKVVEKEEKPKDEVKVVDNQASKVEPKEEVKVVTPKEEVKVATP